MRKRGLRALWSWASLGLIGLSGCATYPRPENVAGIDTYQIVQNVRCEVREAIRGYTISFLRGSAGLPELAQALNDRTLTFDDFDSQRERTVSSEANEILNRYYNSSVAYGFEFDMTQSRSLGTNIDLLSGFKSWPTNIGFSGSVTAKKENIRRLDVADRFGSLVLSPVMDRVCKNTKSGVSFAYPITGTLGLSEMIGTFLSLNQSGNLVGSNKVPTLSDTIKFTTSLVGRATASAEPVPTSNLIRVAKASVDGSASREDVHSLTIVLSLDPAADDLDTVAEKRALAELEKRKKEDRDLEARKIGDRLVETLN